MTRKTRLTFAPHLGVFALAGLLFAASGCSTPASAKTSTEEAPPVVVESAVAVSRQVPKVLQLPGSLHAFQEAHVAADQSGRVVGTFVERGDSVRLREPLVRLDARAATLGTAESRAQAAALEAQRQNAALECQRAEQLFAARAIPRAEYDRMTASCTATGHSVDAARARQRLAEQAVGDAVVRAPFAGRVAERRVTAGEYVTAGTRVATIVDTSKLRLEIEVPESAIAAIREGLNVEFSVAAYPGARFDGKVVYVGPVVQERGRDQVIEALVDNAGEKLKPGMFATTLLTTGHENLPVIPERALAGTEASRRVFVIKGSAVEERVVLPAESRSGSVAIRKGLAAGERVVLSPAPSLRDGQRVK